MTERSEHDATQPSHKSGAPDLWRRLVDHRIAQWAAAYVGLAYAIQHAVVLTGEAFEWPQIVQRITMLLLILGAPVVVTLAWYHGARASRSFSRAEFSIVSLLVAIGALLFYVFVRPEGEAAVASSQAGVVSAREAAASPKGVVSVAVLPFLDLSPAKDQEYFSDGMSEEITTALAKIPDLRVVARTSAFEFKGEKRNVQSIGEQLHATHLIEGSVRKAGNRLRITVQLIKADDGTHIWAEDYDRELTDVFAIQEDIARAITASFHMTLGLKAGENLVNNRKIDPQAYTDYLRIRAKVSAAGNQRARDEAVTELEKLLAREPDFAPGWAYLAQTRIVVRALFVDMWTRSLEQTHQMVDDLYRQAERDAREAIRLDPTQAVSYSALAAAEANRGNWAASEDLLTKALQLDPNNTDVLLDAVLFSIQTGRLNNALIVARDAQALDPLAPLANYVLALSLVSTNQASAAIELLQTHPQRLGVNRGILAHAYAEAGQFEKVPGLVGENDVQRTTNILLHAVTAKQPPPAIHPHPDYNWLFAYSSQPERAIEGPERALQAGLRVRVYAFDHSLASVRNTERFKKLVRDAGLVDYWRARGWPDMCHPVGQNDFACN